MKIVSKAKKVARVVLTGYAVVTSLKQFAVALLDLRNPDKKSS